MRGSEPFTIDDVLETPSLREVLARLVFEYPAVVEMREAAKAEARHAQHAFYDWAGLLHGPNDEFLDFRCCATADLTSLDEFEVLWRDSEAPLAKLMLEDAKSRRAQEAFSREVRWRVKSLFGRMLGTGRLAALGLNAVSLQVEQVPAAVWTHQAFSVRIETGDVLQALTPDQPGLYVPKMKPRWDAVTLQAGEVVVAKATREVAPKLPVIIPAAGQQAQPTNKRGAKRWQTPRIKAMMHHDLDNGIDIVNWKQEAWEERYSARRSTCKKALDEVLAERTRNSNKRRQSTNSDNA
ncbi:MULTISPECIES: hypothetical protein [unclassified Bradyrhizobium]|uniref:hypothetical protein n=1 Tax=unclassified Bradyrhizobium TaxID=2631580 RepID=UPI0028ECBE28|nr:MULTISPECIES: hypothetical protein [unclassified Bradyrhizobium]